MFIRNIHGQEASNILAQQLGCEAGVAISNKELKGSGYGRPGLVGYTYKIKDRLKQSGARWDASNKAWTFDSWDSLDCFLNEVISS